MQVRQYPGSNMIQQVTRPMTETVIKYIPEEWTPKIDNENDAQNIKSVYYYLTEKLSDVKCSLVAALSNHEDRYIMKICGYTCDLSVKSIKENACMHDSSSIKDIYISMSQTNLADRNKLCVVIKKSLHNKSQDPLLLRPQKLPKSLYFDLSRAAGYDGFEKRMPLLMDPLNEFLHTFQSKSPVETMGISVEISAIVYPDTTIFIRNFNNSIKIIKLLESNTAKLARVIKDIKVNPENGTVSIIMRSSSRHQPRKQPVPSISISNSPKRPQTSRKRKEMDPTPVYDEVFSEVDSYPPVIKRQKTEMPQQMRHELPSLKSVISINRSPTPINYNQ